MRGCGCAFVLVLPFWVAAYVIGGIELVVWLVLAGAAVELVLFRDDWIAGVTGLRRRLGR